MTSKSTKSKKSSKSGKSSSKKDDAKKAEEESAKLATEEAKSQADASKTDKDGAAATEEGAVPVEVPGPGAEPAMKEKGWFTKQNIQNFIHFFIGEKLKVEKLTFVVGHAYLKFIEGLEKPMKLNEMRNMKADTHS